ncbi:E3 ubiquitin-protein ligase TRIM33-like [Anneissia japonica]|uniref:E3 ubiquitin-protein ligase TRIM33-like n=1 Tax=Anneissia japonica TaxID=1529436 RepID=UPI0014254D8A|nr:E3 ubiquitin-protein ligase TRIM33-like [Anneissia japonica]
MASKCNSKEIIAGIEAVALECPLCMERYTDPKSLPCIHSFCLLCLEKSTKECNGILSCPTCREVCKIPGGLKKLPNNTFIIGLLEYVNTLEQKSAPTCACENEACYFCRDCDELYCRECKDAHRKIKITRNHTMMTLEEYKSIDPAEKFSSKRIFCLKHTMELKLFCGTCKKLVCGECILVDHPTSKGHNIIDTKDAFQTFSARASQLVKTSGEKLQKLHALNDDLKNIKSVLNSNFSKCKTDITRQADELHRLIDRHKEDQLHKIEESHKQKLKSLDTEISDMLLAICKLSSMCGVMHNLLNCPNQVMALMSSSEAAGRLQKLVKSDDRTEPKDVGVLEYKPDSRFSQLLEISVVKQLRRPDTQISPKESKILVDIQFMFSNSKRFAHIKTRNALGQCVYIIDAKVKCLAINRVERAQHNRNIIVNNDRNKIETINVTDKQNGVYEIPTDIGDCTLLCLIIDRSKTYFSTLDYNQSGSMFTRENHFKKF